MKKIKTIAVLCFAMAIAFVTFAQSSQSTPSVPSAQNQDVEPVVKAGDACPDFKFVDPSGKFYTLADFKGKYVYMDVWATWCGPCVREIPYLKDVEEKMHGKNIVFVSVSKDQDVNAWKDMLKEKQMTGVQLHYGGVVKFFKAFAINGIPRFLLIGPDGKVVNPNMIRPSTGEELINYFNALLGI